ncbi:DUF2164 domain-containing protein [Rossellomorea sp. KS-H15a]|uniref:DUF2164 domain-containing protein n=1 Tax=Rossellomorea sp. KS-H15a TaxID=2963940 RepID=UPI0020C61941|nr:DUF2164 domain-containing protein [Rossellomorea sp. KS-H15a]UTE75971.1 DUF2164 domain-containing protein [Rossellomorea sp. KS-H15a]
MIYLCFVTLTADFFQLLLWLPYYKLTKVHEEETMALFHVRYRNSYVTMEETKTGGVLMMFTKIPKEQKDEMIGRIQRFHYEQTGDEIGDLGAENWFDFFMKEIGPFLYNKGVMDSKDVLMDKMLLLEDDLYALKRPVNPK